MLLKTSLLLPRSVAEAGSAKFSCRREQARTEQILEWPVRIAMARLSCFLRQLIGHGRVSLAVQEEEDTWLSMVTPRWHAVTDGETWELSRKVRSQEADTRVTSPGRSFWPRFRFSCHPCWGVCQTCWDPCWNVSVWWSKVEMLSVIGIAGVERIRTALSTKPCGTALECVREADQDEVSFTHLVFSSYREKASCCYEKTISSQSYLLI